MSQKKHKKLRREGKDRKTTHCSKYEKCNLSHLRLISRAQLISILKWLENKWIVNKGEQGLDNPGTQSCPGRENVLISSMTNDQRLEDIFSVNNDNDKSFAKGLAHYVMNLKPLHSSRSGRLAIPVSLYHDKITGECLYQIWSVEDYTSYVIGCRVITKETAHLPKELRTYLKRKIAPQQTPVAGGVNTVLLSLGSMSQLEEHLPVSGVTLDDLIWLGRHHEEFSPLTYDEMQNVISSTPQDQLSNLYDMKEGSVRVKCITYSDSSVYYQPEKSRYAWGLCVMSVPVEFTDKPGVALVPVYRSAHMTIV